MINGIIAPPLCHNCSTIIAHRKGIYSAIISNFCQFSISCLDKPVLLHHIHKFHIIAGMGEHIKDAVGSFVGL